MLLKFPNLETFQQVLTDGSVPAEISQESASAGLDEQNRPWIATRTTLPQASVKQLRKFGVTSSRGSRADFMETVVCWHQLVPLKADATATEHLEQIPVLFETADGAQLNQLVSEMLRLGNDRQSYRWIEEQDEQSSRGLLRVVGPPYYSLLRALEHGDDCKRLTAYVERAPGIWIQLGYTHPLVERIKPATGQMVLIRSPRKWTMLKEAPFRDVYEITEFQLPKAPIAYQEAELDNKIRVNLSLRLGGPVEGGELWVLRDEPIDELDRFVENADDALLQRLAFAVGQHGSRTTVVVRARQSKLPPPVLVLKGLTYRPYLKLPNLYLPCGTNLHPPLRRDQVRKLLAEDPGQLTWLVPHGDGGFIPESLPEEAFRPLSDWIDYILDHDRVALEAWVQASQFDFEGFVCKEDDEPKPRKQNELDRQTGRAKSNQQPGMDFEGAAFTPAAVGESSQKRAERGVEILADDVQTAPDTLALKERVHQLENEFQAVDGALDAVQRQLLWPELANLYDRLGDDDDAAVSWLNALWFQETLAPDWSGRWFRSEAAGVPGSNGECWFGSGNLEIQAENLDVVLGMKEPSAADVRALGALLAWAAHGDRKPQALLERLNPIQRFLESHEKLLPVRAVWLAWLSLVELSGGDVLGLARVRDRLLERLYHNGLRQEQDMPSFLRFSGQPASQRFRAVRRWVLHLAELAQDWVRRETPPDSRTPMKAYVELIFAFGLARLGETDASRELLGRAEAGIEGEDKVHQFLLRAYRYRIYQALEGKPHAGPLPDEELRTLEQWDRNPRYAVDRMRQVSRILEPHQKIEPLPQYLRPQLSPIDRQLAELVDETDHLISTRTLKRLLAELPNDDKTHGVRARILCSALDLAPRISETFGREILDEAIPAYDALSEPDDASSLGERGAFLEKALFLAAHFDSRDHINPLVNRFETLLRARMGLRAVQAVASVAGQCLRSLRKFGMRDQIDRMLASVANVVLDGGDLPTLAARIELSWHGSLRALLHVAAGWIYFGKEKEADPVLQAARTLLFHDELPPLEKSALACVYASTLGLLPVDVAQQRLEEMFRRMAGVRDSWMTWSLHRMMLSQLNVIEAVVLAVASEDFTLGSKARRCLDEDEFIVRQRIHRDMRRLLGSH